MIGEQLKWRHPEGPLQILLLLLYRARNALRWRQRNTSRPQYEKNRTVRFSRRFPENVGRDTLYVVVREEDEGRKQIINTCVRPNLLIIYFIPVVAFCSGRRRRTVSHNKTRTLSVVAWYTCMCVCVCAGSHRRTRPVRNVHVRARGAAVTAAAVGSLTDVVKV